LRAKKFKIIRAVEGLEAWVFAFFPKKFPYGRTVCL